MTSTLNEASVGRSFGPWTSGVTADKLDAAGGEPLLFAAVLAEEACAWPLADPAVVGAAPARGWLPGELEITLGEAPVEPGGWITTVARIADIGASDDGERIVIDTASQSQGGELLAQARSTFLLNRRPPSPRQPIPPVDNRKTQPITFDFVTPSQIVLPTGHKSGDSLPRVTPLRNAVAALKQHRTGRLRRLTIRFSMESFAGMMVITHGRRRSRQPGLLTIEFQTIGRQSGPLLEDGIAEILE